MAIEGYEDRPVFPGMGMWYFNVVVFTSGLDKRVYGMTRSLLSEMNCVCVVVDLIPVSSGGLLV